MDLHITGVKTSHIDAGQVDTVDLPSKGIHRQ